MALKFIESKYENYGKCLSISNGTLEIKVTLDLGPRIIYAAIDNKGNMFYNDLERLSHKSGEEMESVFDKGDEWFNYGGTRLWFSPEELPLTYYPDNSGVNYIISENTVTLTPPIQKVTHMQQKFIITMDEEKPLVKVDYNATNTGSSERNFALWALSVCDKGGVAIIPQPTEKTGLLANRNIALWEYTDMSDKRVLWGKKYIGVKQLFENDIKPFKIGINNTSGYLAYANKDCLFIKRYIPNHTSGNYPDYGMSSEIYTDKDIIELETLSELYTFKPGMSVTHTENWEFISGVKTPALNQDEISKIVNNYIQH